MASQLVKLTFLLLCLYSAIPLVLGRGSFNICSGGRKGHDCNIQCFQPDPVCGADGVTYGCGCPEANCKGIRVVKKGPCFYSQPPSDICGNTYGWGPGDIGGGSCAVRCLRANPVCGVNGVTYWCGCPEASCNRVRVVKKGAC